MMAFSIDIHDRATPPVSGILTALQERGAAAPMARAVVELVQDHFYRLNESRANKLGGQRANFYSQAAKATNFQETPDGFIVSVNHVGIRQRLEGGPIAPRNVKYLTI